MNPIIRKTFGGLSQFLLLLSDFYTFIFITLSKKKQSSNSLMFSSYPDPTQEK